MKILVTSYISPDLDGFACAIAYAELLNNSGEEVEAAIYGAPHDEALFLIDHFNLNIQYSVPNPKGHHIILVDMSELNGKEERINPDQVIEVIDHRKSNDSHLFLNAKIQIELVGSAATLIAEKYKESGATPTRVSAILLHGAIISNTLNFKAAVTTERDRSMAEWLGQYSQLPANFARELFVAKSKLDSHKLLKRLESEYAVFIRSGRRMSIIQLEIVDGLKFIIEHCEEIKRYLTEQQTKNQIDYMFLTTIDLLDNQNIFYSPNQATQQLLAKTLNVIFDDGIAIRPGFIMRKELVPLLEREIKNELT